MEVKINKEIQSYSESLFFGLSLRQCGFSLAAVLVSVGLCFLLKPYVGTETEKRHYLAVMPFSWWGKVDSMAGFARQSHMVKTSLWTGFANMSPACWI